MSFPFVYLLVMPLLLSRPIDGLVEEPEEEEESVFPASCQMNVLIVLDRSDSVRGGFNRSRKFVLNISHELTIGPSAHSVALIAYSGRRYRPEIHPWNFAANNSEFREKLENLRVVGGTTDTRMALEAALEMLKDRNSSVPTVILVVTDGLSAKDPSLAAQMLRQVPHTRIVAAATGNPRYINRKELLQIAGRENAIIMENAYESAEAMTRRLLREAQDKCRTTTTTTTTTQNPISGCEQDLVFLMDFSTSTFPVYRDYMRLAVELVARLSVGPRLTRVALVVFSSEEKTKTEFNLNAHKSAAEVIAAIRALQFHYAGGTTALGAGLREAAKQALPTRGGRPGQANQLLVVFTDGWNNMGPDPTKAAREAKAAGFRVLAVAVEHHGAVVKEQAADQGEQHLESAPVKKQTIQDIVQSPDDTFTDRNFDALIRIAQERNRPCMIGSTKRGNELEKLKLY